MIVNLILLLLVAHFLSDFIFQGERMSEMKAKNVFSGYHFLHFLIVLSLTFICSLDLKFWWAALIIGLSHLLIDMLKSKLHKIYVNNDLFFVDQLIHLLIIIGVAFIYNNFCAYQPLYNINTKTIAVVLGFIICSKPSNIIIKYLLELFKVKISDNEEDLSIPNAGKLIGFSERYLALVLIIVGAYEAVGLIIAAKSVLRINSESRSEYVLVGTLLSFLIAIFSGILITLI